MKSPEDLRDKEVSGKDCPTTEQLAQFLEPPEDNLSEWDSQLTPNQSSVSAHIESCSSCQRTLESLAADERWWREARQSLSATQYDEHRHSATTHIMESICALPPMESGGRVQDPLCEYEIEQLTALLEPPSHPELLGRIGRYELEQLVGRGGMGLVFRGYDTQLHRVVAVKTLAVHLVPIGSARQRFIREGRAGAALVHPAIVPVHDVITDGPVPALVMQYVAGPTLESWLEQHGPLPWRQAIELAIQLLEALALAHDKGLIHRDIKPGNVLLEADASRALLTDFGLVRTLDDATLTKSGMLAGTPDFMSPEQARGESVGPTSDLFSFGALMFAMLTGKPPFHAADPMATLNRICHQRHPALAEVQPELPVQVSRLVDRLLAKSPHRRPQSASDLNESLQDIARGKLHVVTLGQQKMRRRLLAIATLLILCLGAVWSVSGPNWFSPQTQRAELEAISGPSDSSQSPSTSQSESTEAGGGFAELEQLDEGIRSATVQVDHLLQTYSTPLPPDVKDAASPFTNSDRQLQQLLREVRGIEQELTMP